jgi:hypothetical protein
MIGLQTGMILTKPCRLAQVSATLASSCGAFEAGIRQSICPIRDAEEAVGKEGIAHPQTAKNPA